MEVNDALIEKLANLACLEFNDMEKEEIKRDLQRMVTFVEKLNEVDTSGVAPLLQMTEEINVLREDKIELAGDRNVAFRNAPDTDGSYFLVPKVIKNANT